MVGPTACLNLAGGEAIVFPVLPPLVLVCGTGQLTRSHRVARPPQFGRAGRGSHQLGVCLQTSVSPNRWVCHQPDGRKVVAPPSLPREAEHAAIQHATHHNRDNVAELEGLVDDCLDGIAAPSVPLDGVFRLLVHLLDGVESEGGSERVVPSPSPESAS